ncbi:MULTISPECIES: hypothetical protein [unclassified Burkholderia]|uniref:hypothetical protein n=1 Tax=unclassified Burkholderia TaxID=2613784 RepID=UPI002AAF36B0|nr:MULTISPECIES: hypothetical protein [unclassified Burkholderia]
MKHKISIVMTAILLGMATTAQPETLSSKFSNYSTPIYTGKLKIPDYYKKTDDGWRDDEGKLVDTPNINFAGKYFIGRHSCGTECIYYSLSDLTTGKDYNYLDMFSSGGDTPTRTRDGRRYFTELISMASSRLLIAKYHISASPGRSEECKQKEFELNNSGKISPTSKNTARCNN